MKSALLALPLFLLCLPAHADQPAQTYQVESGEVIVCDTQKQVERFAQLFDGDAQIALGAVNHEEHNPSACVTVDATYVTGAEIGTVRSGSRAFRIVPIMVLAADTTTGYRAIDPTLFFTPVP